MPLLSIQEVRFVPLTWEGDPRGYAHETVLDPQVIAAWKRYFDEELAKAKIEAKLCTDGHQCPQFKGEPLCEFRVRRLTEDMYTPRKAQLVKITIPTAPTAPE